MERVLKVEASCRRQGRNFVEYLSEALQASWSGQGIKLINPDGSKPSLQTYVLHFTIGYWINQVVLCLGYIWAIFETNKKTWVQKIFKDLTVRGNW